MKPKKQIAWRRRAREHAELLSVIGQIPATWIPFVLARRQAARASPRDAAQGVAERRFQKMLERLPSRRRPSVAARLADQFVGLVEEEARLLFEWTALEPPDAFGSSEARFWFE